MNSIEVPVHRYVCVYLMVPCGSHAGDDLHIPVPRHPARNNVSIMTMLVGTVFPYGVANGTFKTKNDHNSVVCRPCATKNELGRRTVVNF